MDVVSYPPPLSTSGGGVNLPTYHPWCKPHAPAPVGGKESFKGAIDHRGVRDEKYSDMRWDGDGCYMVARGRKGVSEEENKRRGVWGG